MKFYRSKPQFYLISSDEENADYRIQIEDMYLNICKLNLNPGILYGHAEILKSKTAKYILTNTDLKTMAIPQVQMAFT